MCGEEKYMGESCIAVLESASKGVEKFAYKSGNRCSMLISLILYSRYSLSEGFFSMYP